MEKLKMTKKPNNRWIYRAYAVFAVIYLGFILFRPIRPETVEQYGLSPEVLLLVRALLAIPILLIWFTAFYGFSKLREYASLIVNDSEGRALLKISTGLGILAFGLPIKAISTNILRGAGQLWPEFGATGYMIRRYIGLLIMAAAFMYILRGAAKLKPLRQKTNLKIKELIPVVLFIIPSLLLVYLTIAHPAPQYLGEPGEINGEGNSFNISPWLLLFTLVIPYLIIWVIGLRSAYKLYAHRSKVKGKIYKDFLGYLSAGLAVVVLSSIMIQYTNMLAAHLNRLPLNIFLAVLLLFLAALASGYILIARGAVLLKRIEEA